MIARRLGSRDDFGHLVRSIPVRSLTPREDRPFLIFGAARTHSCAAVIFVLSLCFSRSQSAQAHSPTLERESPFCPCLRPCSRLPL
ncbi:hypothetical protein JTE90_026086 [Oedothorax gibbosus]|uniref:Uncharacterized protein n=1 Tax=Oedothorax gibbosus TaxID=931172 RepID=A0AAV6UPI8_9ARAC|nr:hypothetical protein JTE90_026086 [Oedothorax gibbosus]